MNACHNSRELIYRKPFGAVYTGEAVSISMDLWDDEGATVLLRMWVDKKGESFESMDAVKKDGFVRFEKTISPSENGIIWYSFLINRADGTTMWYGAKEGSTGGEGQLYFSCPPSFQLTVSKKRVVPDWYKKGIVYQIFPDRFNRGKGYEANVEKALKLHKNGPERRFVENWDEPVGYEKDDSGRISAWDFYGGNFEGIKEKLSYLKNLGVTVLYLNPIFEAASNHRYDTGNYEITDPMLGTNEDFEDLCKEAEKYGISIILDGVFNHTGCDSRYFNKYGNYDTEGAFDNETSKYREWYRFGEDGGYDCWWGVDDLPNVEESKESYQKYIYDSKDSIVRKWLRAGAKGWRLDVADELPDDFIAGIKKAMIEEIGDEAVLIGEVWEDASNKISYGELRKYLLGDELDAAMNYPFRDGIENFILGNIDAGQLENILMTICENYPKENFYSSLNLIGSHDRIRTLTYMGEAPDAESMSEQERKNFSLSVEQKNLAKGRMWLLVLMQMTMPGVPCIYYGDEAGMEGFADPYNRGTFPWGNEDKDLLSIHQNAINLRKHLSVFTDGEFMPLSYGKEVFGYVRENENEKAIVLVSNSRYNTNVVELDETAPAIELISGQRIEYKDGKMYVRLYPLGSAIVYINKNKKLAKPMEEGKGVLCHITSLPNEKGPGTIGKPAFEFVDYLAENGYKYWQILPVNPVDFYGSPYAGASAFAGNIKLLDNNEKELKSDYTRWKSTRKTDKDFARFEKENEWLPQYAMYMAIKDSVDNKPISEWPDKYKKYDDALYKDSKLAGQAEFYMYCQYVFDREWLKLKTYANEKGISIIGDMPMFVSADSSDVWSNPESFEVDEEFVILKQAGVPPDYFAKDGQAWGNPVYKWNEMRKDGFSWWMSRFKRAFSLYDYVRLDHFRGFEAYWAIAKGKKATEGEWLIGPGRELFERAYEIFGPLPVFAEDLGMITPGVRGLVNGCGFLGTDVMQFCDNDPLVEYIPKRNKIAYSGTHDNQTLIGWCSDRYPDKDIDETVEKMLTNLYECEASIKIIPLQDILGLGDEARMNMPGTAGKNWSWQAKSLK